MATDLQKICATFLRSRYAGLRSGHAHDLAASFFGYSSSISLHSERHFPVERLKEAALVMPAVEFMQTRCSQLSGLPATLPQGAWQIATELTNYLIKIGELKGEVVTAIDAYIKENLDWRLPNLLAGEIALTNSEGYGDAYYDDVTLKQTHDELILHATGTVKGDHVEDNRDRPFTGDAIDIEVTARFPRVAGLIGYAKPDFDVRGEVNYDFWGPPEAISV